MDEDLKKDILAAFKTIQANKGLFPRELIVNGAVMNRLKHTVDEYDPNKAYRIVDGKVEEV